MDLMPGVDKFTTLLGRNFKVTECDADQEFLAKLVALQENPTGLRAKRTVEEVDEDVAPSTLVVNEDTNDDKSEMRDSVEPDGACFSTLQTAKPKRNKVEGVDENNQFVDVETATPTTSSGSKQGLDVQEGKVEEVDMRKTPDENLDVDETEKDEDGEVDGKNVIQSEEPPPHEECSPGDGIQEELFDVEESPPDETVPPFRNMPVSVSNRIDLDEYSQSEWKGSTHSAQHMRLGYSQIMQSTGCAAMRRIRGDNYCGLRATSFQVLSQNLKALQSWEKPEDIVTVPDKLIHDYKCTWLTQWSFAGRLRVAPKKKLDTMRQCLQNLCIQFQTAQAMESYENRIKHFLAFFNSSGKEEILVFEALKLLMLHAAVILHADMTAGKDVPVFVCLLYARDTSETPEQLMRNHLNTVGDSGGLEQVEMFLLGYALNITIRVVRPYKVHQEDFMTHYPDDHVDDWDLCNLIAEDDRHYNAIVS